MSNCPSCGHNIPEGSRFCGACGHQTTGIPERKGLVGTVIADRYRVLRVIAEGGMGIVYEAEQPMGEGLRRVAIKTLLPELSRDPIVVSRFNRECSVVAGLEHPNTVRVYDFGTIEDGSLYIAMEFVAGRPLGDLIAEGPIPLQRCLGIMEQIASALEEAHNQGIVHRDLKPDNIVLSDRAGLRDFVKVLDFGIAKRSSVGGKHDTNLTQQGMVLGTPPYMSPEQFTGEPLDRTSDIYSIAIIFYEMMNSKLPFDGGDTPWQWAHQHISVEPARFAVPVSHELEEVVRAALSKQRSARPQSALEFYRRLCFASGTAPGQMSRMIEPSQPDLSRASTWAKGATSPDVPALGTRTEPSMLRSAGAELPEARVDGSFARGTTAPALSSVPSHSGTGTDPGNLPLRHDGSLVHPSNPALGAERSLARPSAVIAPPPARAARSSRRGIGTWLVGFVSLVGLGG
ncbi:MAG TPA: serine/threonine-protein kinase, partial [Polyangiaceae bacterium]|nr:serine/threonine-protein kinase [Polyangiaceae bacterium]